MAYILVVDDDRDFAETTAIALRRTGHEVDMEHSVDAALANMKHRRPDLLVLDVMFSEDISAGFALAQTIKHRHEKLKNVPVLMVTAVNTRFPLGFGRKDIDEEYLPVSDFLEKPVDLDVLIARVQSLLEEFKMNGSGSSDS